MTTIGHDMKFASSDRGIRLSRMRVPWTRGATSGALLLILGAWAATVPFIGPYLNFAYTPATNTAWNWTTARGWFEVAPGAAAFAGGLLLLAATNRAVTIAGSWLGIAGGAWLIIGSSLTGVLNQSLGTPDPTSSTNVQALEALFFFYAVGALILVLAAAALGRLSVQSVRDVAVAEQRAAQAETAAAAAPATEGRHERPQAAGGQGTPAAPAAPPPAPAAGEPPQPSTSQSEPTYPPPETSNE